MSHPYFKNARFIKTATEVKDYPVLRNLSGEIVPEIAVAGRSNVGKSSLLNHLFQKKGLVKTSSKPGKTQAINFFMVNNEMAFVDLPGYGFADVPESIRKKWGPMVQDYLKERDSLKLILFLFDIRRKPNQDDIQFLEWAAFHQKATILVFTKCDKMNRNERKANSEAALKAFNTQNLHHVYYSVTKNIGHKELPNIIMDALKDEG